MGTFNAGAIEANLTLDRSDWKKDLEFTKREIRDLENTTVTIGIDADADNAHVAMDNIELFLEDLDSKTYTPSIDLDTEKANATLDALEARLDELGARTITVGADADTDNAMIQLSLLEDQMNLLEQDTVNIEADTDISAAMGELAALEARLDELGARTITVGADADTDNAMTQLSLLEDQMDLLDSDPVNIEVNADTAGAAANLDAIAVTAEAISAETVDIDVDIDGVVTALEEMLALEAAIVAVDHNDIDIKVNYDRNAIEGLVGAGASGAGGAGGGSLGLLKILVLAIIAMLPILAVAMGAFSAAVIGFTSALVAALGPLAIFAGGLALLFLRFQDAPEFQVVNDALSNLGDVLDKIGPKMFESGFDVMADALNLVADILPTLVPLFNQTAEMLDKVLGSVSNFVNSPEYDDMLDFFGDFGVDMLETFLRIGGNLLRFFGRLFQAIEPFAREMMQGLEDVTAGWADWADDLENNQAFQHFLETAAEMGPKVLDMLGSMLDAFIAIGHALEPFAGPAIESLTSFFDFIANMDPTILGWLVITLSALFVAFSVVIPMVTSIVAGISALGAISAGVLLPILAIVAAVAAFGWILYKTWQDSEDFRKAVIGTWEDIKQAVEPIIDDLVAFFHENWGPLKAWLRDTFGEYKQVITSAMQVIQIVVHAVLTVITFLWRNFGKDLLRIIKGVFQVIGAIIRGWVQILHGIFMFLHGLLTGDWREMWEGIKQIGRGAATVVSGIIRGLGNILGGIFNGIKTEVTGIWSGLWSAITSKVRSAVGGIETIVRGIASTISNIISGISGSISAIKTGINAVIGRWNSLSFSVPGFDPPGPGPKFDGFTISTPDITPLAKGGLAYDPTLAIVGDNPGPEPEVIAPLSNLRSILGDSVGNLDYDRLASAVSAALETALSRLGLTGKGGITREDLERLIEAAGVKVDIDARGADPSGLLALPSALTFELRRLGYGGKANV